MAAGDPILIGLSGATFLLTAESGGRIQSFSRKVSSKLLEVYNAAVGYTDGLVFHDFMADYDVEVITTANSGIVAASVGAAYTLGNVTSGNGVAGGGTYVLSTNLSHPGEQLQRFSLTLRQRAGLT